LQPATKNSDFRQHLQDAEKTNWQHRILFETKHQKLGVISPEEG
jgi:hypothetical protein